jgi:hypothetical protein
MNPALKLSLTLYKLKGMGLVIMKIFHYFNYHYIIIENE